MTTERISAHNTRITALLIVGTALIVAGVYSVATTFYALLARYMYVEDLELGLEESTIFAVTRVTPVERGIVIIGIVLAVLGIAALVSAAIRTRGARRHRSAIA